jgi:formylglycine-generating enzyme required for sulfatase activity
LARDLCGDTARGPETHRHKLALAAEILTEMGEDKLKDRKTRDGASCLDHVQRLLLERAQSSAFPAKERAQMGMLLGNLGDPRFGVGLKNGLPEMDWIEIPPGKFWMGNKEDYCGGQRFECDVLNKRPYHISRYSVTVAQYQAFVDAGGYSEKGRGWWTVDGWKWKHTGKVTGPEDFDPAFQTPNHPRVGVSWFEAVAF